MLGKEKKPYDAPDIEKIPLSDEALDKVSGGVEQDGELDGEDLGDDPYTGDPAPDFYGPNPEPGILDVGGKRGRGGGCDSVPYHRDARAFSSRRNKSC